MSDGNASLNWDNTNDQPSDHTTAYKSSKTAKDTIIDHLRVLDRPQTSFEIAEHTGLNPATVRARLSELKRAGHVYCPYPRVYQINSGYGGGFGASEVSTFRVQNLRVVSEADLGRGINHHSECVWEWPGFESNTGAVKLRVELGSRFNRVNWVLSASEGLDIQTIRIARSLVELYLHSIGFPEDCEYNWQVRNHEELRELFGVKLEGITSFTLDSLESVWLKVYSKKYGTRIECKSNRIMTFDEFVAVLLGPMPEYNLVVAVNENTKSVKDLVEATKRQNRIVYDLKENVLGLSERVGRVISRISGFSSFTNFESDSS
jgi:hypothetical protein